MSQKNLFCIFDINDNFILSEGSFIEMEDLLDTLSGNYILTSKDQVQMYQKLKEENNSLRRQIDDLTIKLLSLYYPNS